jgi:signal transduction histidine kinase
MPLDLGGFTELEPDLPPVRIRDDDLVLILVNLLINALDAMPDGGEVRIEGRLSRSGEVLVQVTDTGTGMTDEVRRRAMEALYTTKERGSGLGLSTCADTLHSIGGRLELSSVPHRGTAASISLPVAPPEADHIRPVACEVTSA